MQQSIDISKNGSSKDRVYKGCLQLNVHPEVHVNTGWRCDESGVECHDSAGKQRKEKSSMSGNRSAPGWVRGSNGV